MDRNECGAPGTLRVDRSSEQVHEPIIHPLEPHRGVPVALPVLQVIVNYLMELRIGVDPPFIYASDTPQNGRIFRGRFHQSGRIQGDVPDPAPDIWLPLDGSPSDTGPRFRKLMSATWIIACTIDLRHP